MIVSLQALNGKVDGEDEFFLEIRIHDPAKVGDGMNAYVSYKVNLLFGEGTKIRAHLYWTELLKILRGILLGYSTRWFLFFSFLLLLSSLVFPSCIVFSLFSIVSAF